LDIALDAARDATEPLQEWEALNIQNRAAAREAEKVERQRKAEQGLAEIASIAGQSGIADYSQPVVSGGGEGVSGVDVPADYEDLINTAAEKYGVAPDLVAKVIQAESNFNPNAVSSAGAGGLMQLMPATAGDFGLSPEERFDPAKNIDVGTNYLSDLLNRFGGNIEEALAAYNWGMGNVENKGLEQMPEETRNYLSKILGGSTPEIPQGTVGSQGPRGGGYRSLLSDPRVASIITQTAREGGDVGYLIDQIKKIEDPRRAAAEHRLSVADQRREEANSIVTRSLNKARIRESDAKLRGLEKDENIEDRSVAIDQKVGAVRDEFINEFMESNPESSIDDAVAAWEDSPEIKRLTLDLQSNSPRAFELSRYGRTVISGEESRAELEKELETDRRKLRQKKIESLENIGKGINKDDYLIGSEGDPVFGEGIGKRARDELTPENLKASLMSKDAISEEFSPSGYRKITPWTDTNFYGVDVKREEDFDNFVKELTGLAKNKSLTPDFIAEQVNDIMKSGIDYTELRKELLERIKIVTENARLTADEYAKEYK
jgi:hypothetical protein